ncbi:MAG TPA: CDP-alcohol phosphatidyltransferase family protein [Acidimicrobiales bacterium]|nr:CDP-alcohol phosphatidyltransferase family protein [Acidimicrobiales bacterium]
MGEPELTGNDGDVSDRILTAPNVITFVRLLCLPVFLWLLLHDENRAAAAWLLGALGATDFVDGYVARHFHQTSKLGKVLDPVADRLLLFVGISAILYDGTVPIWFAVVVLAREVLVTVATLALAALGAKRIDVTWYGKAGTFANMFAFPLFLGSHSTVSYSGVCAVLAWVAAAPGIVLSYYALLLYIPIARNALREGRQARVGVASSP